MILKQRLNKASFILLLYIKFPNNFKMLVQEKYEILEMSILIIYNIILKIKLKKHPT